MKLCALVVGALAVCLVAWPAGTAEPAARVHAIHVADEDGTLREVRVELVIDGGAEPAAAEALLDE